MLKISQNALGMLTAKYRAVLRNMSPKNSVALVLCASLFCAAPVWAEDITYTGNQSDLKIGTIGGSGTLPGSVYSILDVSGNNVTVNFAAGTNPYRIFGGISDSAAVTGNTVEFRSGTITNSVFGGFTVGGFDAVGNRVIIHSGSNAYNIIGGYSGGGNATGNTVDISGGAINSVYGGESGSNTGHASNNTVNISGSTAIANRVYGAYSTGHAANNTVNISGNTTIAINVLGAYSSGNATGNTVNISGGTVGNALDESTGWVYGGSANSGLTSGNSVTLSGGTVNTIVGGYSASGAVSDNIVTITDGQVLYSVRGGNSETGNVKNNKVVIFGGHVERGAKGGFVFGSTGDAIGNSVLIFGGTFGLLAPIQGGLSDQGKANDNSVTIFESAGGTFSLVAGGLSNSGEASGNSVNISGGSFLPSSHIYGGNSSGNNGTYGDTINNTVTISGRPNLADTSLFGGITGAGYNAFTGNTLNINGFSGSMKGVYNFENYNLFLPSTLTNNTLLTVTNPVDLANTNITITGISGGGTALGVGGRITLISSTSNSPNTINITGVPKGVSLLYDFTIAADGTLVAIVNGVSANPRTKPLSEGKIAGLSFLRQGADLISGAGLKNAWKETKETDGKKVSFGAIEAGSSRYNTGSHANVNGISLLSGIAWKNETAKASLLKGIFLEGGLGNYDTYNSFTNMPSVSTYGDVSYYGLGALIRRDTASGSYLEGSLRGGRSRTSLNGGDLKDTIGQTATYTSIPLYYGAHLGIGRAKSNGDKTVDYYAKYFWTHQNGDDVNILGDTFSFAASDSHRLRGGARLTREKPGGRIATYAGLAYEYEFDGKAKARVHGYDVNTPSLKGGIGIVELGMSYKTHAESMNTLHLSLQGYAGKRQGLSASVQLKRLF